MSCTQKNFDIIAISETGVTKNISLLNNLNFNNYSFEFTPTETSAGGTLLYIANHLSYKCGNDLNIYKKNELESTFIEIVNPKKSNIIVGVIYRHPSMDLMTLHSVLPPRSEGEMIFVSSARQRGQLLNFKSQSEDTFIGGGGDDFR